MNRWGIGWLIVILLSVPVFLSRSSNPAMLEDTDTRVLLAEIRERQDPLAWFVGDWPLYNHFYRPISTLTFEIDNAIWGTNAAGYGLTNALLCLASIFLLFWFLREVTDRPGVATLGAGLFALWHGVGLGPLAYVPFALGVLAMVGSLLPKRRWWLGVAAFLMWGFVASEVVGNYDLWFRMMGWLPGRTASTMTVFALLAMAAYARYERLSAERIPAPESTPLDPPATKGTTPVGKPPRAAWGWPVLAVVSAALALGSYEQAVMLPLALLVVAGAMRWQRYRVRWGWHVLFWAVLGGYLAVRWAFLPAETSGYQEQQLRFGPGVWLSLGDYAMPELSTMWQAWRVVDVPVLLAEIGLAGLILSVPYKATFAFVGNVVAYVQARRDLCMAATGWLLSVVAFLPMAWVKHFDHYHYWPMAMRAFFAAVMFGVAVRLTVSAVSLPPQQAPQRPDPAPGSLPRP